MRVLCLHPAASSALQFSQDLHKLEERLWNKHGIELVFIDGPLLDVPMQLVHAVGEDGGGIHALDPCGANGGSVGDGDGERVSRRWYVAEPSTRTALPSVASPSTSALPMTSSTKAKIHYSGLDASLLHLSQIWSRGGANISHSLGECMPFQGVLGYGQGAHVAALLPLLNRHDDYNEDGGGGDSSDEEGKESNSAAMNKEAKAISMFEGLQFVVLIDGKDILLQCKHDENNDDDGNSVDENELVENDVYVGPDGVHSLHVILDGSSSSERLAKQYGPNATFHNCKLQPNDTTPSLGNMSSSSTLFNIIGKFLVTQKNKLHSNSKSRELMILQHQLLNVEQLATIAISEEIQRNPPNALMAVIGPSAMMPKMSSGNNNDVNDGKLDDTDINQQGAAKEVVKVVDKAVGAWQGGRRRGFGEEGGGAPCPEEFLLREEERGDAVRPAAQAGHDEDDESDDDDIPILQNLNDETGISSQQHIDNEAAKINNNLPPVPVTILTGFLGSGKSTLVRHILTSSSHQKRIAVIENEFGDGDINDVQRMGMTMNNDASTLSVENMIIKDGTDGSSLTDYIELPNGCVCCTVKDSLVETLEALLIKRSDLDYIIIEASGMADPGPVASIFWLDEALNSRLRLDGIVACVDAKNIAFQLESTSSAASSRGTMTEEGEQGGGGDEAARQLAFADRIIVNKIDLLQHDNENDIKSVIRQIQNINPTAPIKTTTYSKIEELDWILDANCFDAERAKDVDSAFQLVIDDDAKGEIIPVGESAVGMQNDNMCKIGCCIGNHPPNGVCGICGGTEPQLFSPSINLHRHTNAVGTVALFGCGSVDLHRVHCWLASILWPNQDVSDRILRAKLEASHLEHAETKGQNTEDDANSKSRLIYRVKGILSVRHAIDNMGKIIPASNDWVDDGIVAGVIDSIDGLDRRRFILQSVHDLWDVFPASENLNWETTETRCCKVIVIGKYLDKGELQDGFNACFNN